jgi:hypothetical protein
MPEDPEYEVVRRAISSDTTKSFKETICAWVLIRAASRRRGTPPGCGPPPSRRGKVVAGGIGLAALASARWWHVIASAVSHIRW